MCWSASSTRIKRMVPEFERLQQAQDTGQEVDCLRVRERMDRMAGTKAVKKEERWCRATGELELALL